MKGSIDKSSPIPYYVQLKELLLDAIARNAFPDGKLPSEKEIARHYGITVTTVRKVLTDLQNLDKITKVKGLGSFIKKPKLELDIAKYLSFGRILREKGLSEKIEVIRRERIDFSDIALNGHEVQNPSRRVICIERVRSIEGKPLAIERLFFNNDTCGPMMGKASDELIYDFLVRVLKIDFSRIEEYLEPVNLSASDARLLKVKANSAALVITKVSHDQRGAWLEYSTTTIRGDQCRYHVSVK